MDRLLRARARSSRAATVTIVATLILPALGSPEAANAQSWNDARTRALVTLATERRALQLADTGLAAYAATAHGYLTFLAQLGEGFPDPPKVVKADEIALEVYWRAPNYSKQVIVGRRDTLVLPTDIQYHRDHLGIVQNNFPDFIRLGEGDEVRDVPHPLSATGGTVYDFAISDSLRIGIPGRTIEVYEVKFRPRDDRMSAAVGAVYLAREDAQVVRMAFSFTRAALIDHELEDVSIVLENALIEGRFWLPRRQEIEIRRTGTWLDFPARGIIRGRWEICCYRVNQAQPAAFFAGPEIVVAPPAVVEAHRWEGAILDSLPTDVGVASEQEVRRVQAEARALVSSAALARSRRTSVSAPRLSDIGHVARAEGLSLGFGVRRRLGAGLDAAVLARFGVGDHEPKGSLEAGWRNGAGDAVRLRVFREYRDAGDEAETSGIRNSLAAQEFGSDYSDPFDARGAELVLERRGRTNGRWRATLGYEWHDSVRVMAHPTFGAFQPVLPVVNASGPRLALAYENTAIAWPAGLSARARVDLRSGLTRSRGYESSVYSRAFADVEIERKFGERRLVFRALGGAAGSDRSLPVEENLFAGGPLTAPGYEFHQFGSSRLVAFHAEWQVPVPFPTIPLGRWGRIPGRASIVPLGSLLGTGRPAAPRFLRAGWYPSLGLGLQTLFDLLRFDVARGLRDGRWTFSVDVARDFWRIM